MRTPQSAPLCLEVTVPTYVRTYIYLCTFALQEKEIQTYLDMYVCGLYYYYVHISLTWTSAGVTLWVLHAP